MGGAIDYLPALALGQRAATITGVSNDAFPAMGYASFIQAITGEMPTVVDLGNKKARILLSERQVAIMKKWLELRVAAGIKLAKSPSNLEINAKPFIMPVVLKYALPALVAMFALGWFAHNMIGGR